MSMISRIINVVNAGYVTKYHHHLLREEEAHKIYTKMGR